MISCKFISQTIKCFGAGYESIWRKAHNIPELISSQQPRGPSMETWIKGSVQWLFTFLSLFLRHHQVAKAFITSAATAPLLPADGEEWTSTKKREEAVIKDRGSGTISAWRPHPARSPGPGTWSSSCVVRNLFLYTQTASHLFSMRRLYLSALRGTSTNMLWKITLDAKGKTLSHEQQQSIKEHTFNCMSGGFHVRSTEAGPNQTASGGILSTVNLWCIVLCYVD